MNQIYTANGDNLIELPNRTTATFASGLMRVDQVLTCPTRSVANARASLQNGSSLNIDAGQVDGLYIHPAPQERQTEYGFTEFQVSAYGRTSTSIPDPVATEVILTDGGTVFSLFDLFYQITLPAEEVYILETLALFESDLTTPNYIKYLDFFVTFIKKYGGNGLDGFYDFYTFQHPTVEDLSVVVSLKKPKPTILTQRNFGKFIELDIMLTRIY